MTTLADDVLDKALPEIEQRFGITPRLTKYVTHQPHPKQQVFLSPPVTALREVFFGGAAGGGKSDALLMSALQYVDVPGYAAILFRRTFADLALEGAIMDRSKDWLRGTDAHWNEGRHRWEFPAGSSLSFGYIQHAGDERRYQSAEFQFIGFDEVTDFSETAYEFMFSRLRKTTTIDVPLRMRSASNPIGPGKAWVEQRFIISGPDKGRLFIPSQLEDNPSLDAAEYERSLRELGSVMFRQLRYGDWKVKPAGNLFKRAWFFAIPQTEVPSGLKLIRRWDLAATETPKGTNARRLGDPDYTVGLLLGRDPAGIFYVLDVVRDRVSPSRVEQLVRDTAERDGTSIPVRMEQEGGSSGKSLISHYRRNVLDGFDFRGVPSTGSKETRATPIAARAEAGEVILVAGPWVEDFLDEVTEFPAGVHDDQVDALSGAYADLTGRKGRVARAVSPQGFTASSHWLDA